MFDRSRCCVELWNLKGENVDKRGGRGSRIFTTHENTMKVLLTLLENIQGSLGEFQAGKHGVTVDMRGEEKNTQGWNGTGWVVEPGDDIFSFFLLSFSFPFASRFSESNEMTPSGILIPQMLPSSSLGTTDNATEVKPNPLSLFFLEDLELPLAKLDPLHEILRCSSGTVEKNLRNEYLPRRLLLRQFPSLFQTRFISPRSTMEQRSRFPCRKKIK